jgi:hypothetical protein
MGSKTCSHGAIGCSPKADFGEALTPHAASILPPISEMNNY